VIEINDARERAKKAGLSELAASFTPR